MGATVVNIRPAQSKVTAEWERIGPKEAEAILNNNKLNRTLSDRLVERYAAEMKAGEWDEENAETIKISRDGELLDGQHRLWGVVYSEKTLKFLVARGLSRDSFKTIGIGKTRTVGDVVSIAGVKNSNNMAAAAALYMALKKKQYKYDTDSPARLFKRSEIIDYAIENKEKLYDSLLKVEGKQLQKLTATATRAAIHHFIMNVSKVHNREQLLAGFFQQLSTGIYDDHVSDSKVHPIHLLRERLIANSGNTQSRMKTPVIVAMYVKTWNAYVTGKIPRALRVAFNEPFPVPA